MNSSFVKKLADLETSMSRDMGEFELFGVLLREESPEKWDLVVAAPWLDPDNRESFKLVADALQEILTREEFLEISRIVILEKGNQFLENLLAVVSVEHSPIEIIDFAWSSISIRRAYIVTSKRRLAQKLRRNRGRRPTE
jgi:hypothetical protein